MVLLGALMMGSRSVLIAALVDRVLCLCLLPGLGEPAGPAEPMLSVSRSEAARPPMLE